MGQSPPTSGTQHNHWRGTAAHTVILLPPTACPGQSCATTPSPPPIQIPFCAQKSSREQHKKPTLQAKTPLFPLRPATYPSSYQPQYKLSAEPALLATGVCSQAGTLHGISVPGAQKRLPFGFSQQQQSDIHAAMGNSGAVQLLGWFWYTFPFSLAAGFKLWLQTCTFRCSGGWKHTKCHQGAGTARAWSAWSMGSVTVAESQQDALHT